MRILALDIGGLTQDILLFDTTNMVSFVNIEKWVTIVKKHYETLPILLIAAKCDLEEFSMVGDFLAEKTQKRFKMVGYEKTSSKTGMNVDLAFDEYQKAKKIQPVL